MKSSSVHKATSSTLIKSSRICTGAAQVVNQSWTPRPILNLPYFSLLPTEASSFHLQNKKKYIKPKQTNKQTAPKEKGKMEN